MGEEVKRLKGQEVKRAPTFAQGYGGQAGKKKRGKGVEGLRVEEVTTIHEPRVTVRLRSPQASHERRDTSPESRLTAGEVKRSRGEKVKRQRGLYLHHAFFDGVADEVGLPVHLQFVHDIISVGVHSMQGQLQFFRYLFTA